MKYKFDKILSLKLFLILTLILSTITKANISYPELSFVYDFRGQFIDSLGYWFSGFKKIDQEQKERFKKNLPNLLSYWKEQAPILFGEFFSIFNSGFKQKNRTAIIFLGASGGFGSSNFLLLGLNSYLDSEIREMPISREDDFVSLVFHELLHIWLDENINGKSAILAKYCNEHSLVRDHIHLMAIQKMIYIKLNRYDILQMLEKSYRKFALYQRAWEIVNDIEGYEKVIQDIVSMLISKN